MKIHGIVWINLLDQRHITRIFVGISAVFVVFIGRELEPIGQISEVDVAQIVGPFGRCFELFCHFYEPLIAHIESPTGLFMGDGVSGLVGHFIARVLLGYEFSEFIEEYRQGRVGPFVVHLQLSALATCELYALRFARFNDQEIGRSVGKEQLQLCLFLDGWVVIDGNSLLIEREFIERLGLRHEHTSAQQRGVRGFYDGQLCVDQAGKKGQKAD